MSLKNEVKTKELKPLKPSRYKVGTKEIKQLKHVIFTRLVRPGEPAHQKLAKQLQVILKNTEFTSQHTRQLFYDLLANLGVSISVSEVYNNLPCNNIPYWIQNIENHLLYSYQSKKELPNDADVVIIGAGLSGSAAAYFLSSQNLKIVVLDQGAHPACEASGRNGGHFEMIPENCLGFYKGLVKDRYDFLKVINNEKKKSKETLQKEAEYQANVVMKFAIHNRNLLQAIIEKENIQCDFSPKGWLHFAATQAECESFLDEAIMAKKHDRKVQLWTPEKIAQEFNFGISRKFCGRFVQGDGSYHPFKYVDGILQIAMKRGVQLYTNTQVYNISNAKKSISPIATKQQVHTNRGIITAQYVIVATNAFTRDLLPELHALHPRHSQIMVTEHAQNRTRGRIVTSEIGPVYFHQPDHKNQDKAPLIMGGGPDRKVENPQSRDRSLEVHQLLVKERDLLYPELKGIPPSREWVGPMGYTPDQLPAIGLLRPGLIVIAGFNGYGGSYTTAAGQAAAYMVMSNGIAPEWAPQDVFSPRRLLEMNIV